MSIGLALTFIVPAVVLADPLRRMHAQMLRLTTRRADMSMGDAAREAGKDLGQLSRQFDGLEGSLPTLFRQPPEWWQWYAVAIVEQFGLPRAIQCGQQLRDVAEPADRRERA